VRYFNSLDARDWPAMRATLAGTIDLDFSQLFSDPCAVLDSDDFVAHAVTVLSGFRATQHVSANHVITIDGDRARALASMSAWHRADIDPGVVDMFMLRGAGHLRRGAVPRLRRGPVHHRGDPAGRRRRTGQVTSRSQSRSSRSMARAVQAGPAYPAIPEPLWEVAMSNWLRAVYDRADALDAEGYARFFEEDGTFTLANDPPMRGRAEITAGLTQFFGAIAGMRHEFLHSYRIDDTEITEAAVTYTRKDGTQITLPGMTICVRNQDRIRESRAYIDIGPLFR
jgi:hypothetical protein